MEQMYIWILIAIVTGVTIAVMLSLLFMILSFSTKSWLDNREHYSEEQFVPVREDRNTVITDPYSGKLMNLERGSTASSLRSTKSIGFIAYDNQSDTASQGAGRATFHTGSIKSVRSNRSIISTPTGSINREMKYLNVNPLFKEDPKSDEPRLNKSTKMRAMELMFE
ncbi:uncharacterized protein LOC114524440 isoform X2 [Dendronephthya gigantea]|uniref:uncharacterized protein LOC114524440 isoform X2 n=1 Tax=Dendronephthya gigantea TaxID=151771 RepID=UPI0010697C38|nr:uncharacterized protein LOC114524440 isoform X2 [Dendronephthya gigantea]